ncbi:hypothetical protein [Synechocystis sp. PCC 7509]|uniref:hypothetical protein n=1 Tax=Synechocystis sp. PCC 7509 TaxID=927677 RepID=UPI0002ACD70D|nr:hypothetical protein [Synechocystis sp. PCC 7509]
MKCSASLLGLNVADYFNLCNWQLLPPPSNNLPKQAKITAPHCPTVLSALSVKDFFETCNWQLLPPTEPEKDNDSTSPLSPPQVEHDVQNPIVLRRLTVTEFFGLCNWHSLPLKVITQPLEPESSLEPKSLKTWQVQAFFQRISWEGSSPEIGRLPQASTLSELISPASGEMNLNDLSNLF